MGGGGRRTPHRGNWCSPTPQTESNQAATQPLNPHTKQTAPITQHLPPLFKLIEQGKVLALNMPAGINPALSRAVGVMLKNAWLQALLMRPAKMKHSPGQLLPARRLYL